MYGLGFKARNHPAEAKIPVKGDRPPFGLAVVIFEAPKMPLDIFGDLI